MSALITPLSFFVWLISFHHKVFLFKMFFYFDLELIKKKSLYTFHAKMTNNLVSLFLLDDASVCSATLPLQAHSCNICLF
jgi:hypothetical protein